MPDSDLVAFVESLLFVASGPTSVSKLAEVLAVSDGAVDGALRALDRCYSQGRRGIVLQWKNGLVQLASAPQAAPYVERFLGLDLSTRLSTAAMETLAVIAYRQPVTRGEIEAIRGVSCDGVLRTLLGRGLVEPVGRLEQVGRPFQYGVTFQFLQHLGIQSLDALPPLADDGSSDQR